MEKIVSFSPAWDKRNADPNKNYGIHGVELRFVLKGKLGATNFTIFTNWHLPEVQQSLNRKRSPESLLPLPADFGYHSPKPLYDNAPPITDDCPYLDGKPCYYDGSGLYAEKVYERLLREGDGAVWEELEESYKDRFGKLK